MGHLVDKETTEWLHVRVVVNASLSTRRPVTSGVPQESGQILLNVFVSNTGSGTKHTLSTFADDTTLCEAMPSRGTLTCLRDGPMQTSWSSTKWSNTSYTRVTAIPGTPTGWAKKWLTAVLQRRTWGDGWWKLNVSYQCVLTAQKASPRLLQ